VVRDARLFLASGVTIQTSADMDVRSGPTSTLEGHVHLTFTGPSAGAANPQATIVDTNRAVLIGQPGGESVVQVEEATVQTVSLPQFVGTPQILPQILTLNSITPNFRDADISKVAAAVSMATHRTFVIDPRVRAQLNMHSSAPMTPEAFDQAFLEILRTRGFVAMPVGPAANAVMILPGTNGP
jgi:hypothetical protein